MAGEGQRGGPHGGWSTPWQVRNGMRSSWRLEYAMAGEERDEVLMEAGVHHGR
jgi:hypothetical protein